MPHVHNGLHEYARLLDGAARAIGEKSGAQDFSGIERFGETLTPVMNLWEMPEWALLRGEILFSRRVTAAAVAARFSAIEFVNPATSGVLAVILRIVPTGNSGELVVDSGAALGVTATAQGLARDTRYPILGESSRCTLVTGDHAGGAAFIQQFLASGEQGDLPWVLRPGTKLWMFTQAVNLAISGAYCWTERPLLPTENRA